VNKLGSVDAKVIGRVKCVDYIYRKAARMVSYRKGRNTYRSFHEQMGIPPYLLHSLQPSFIINTFSPHRSLQYPSDLIESP